MLLLLSACGYITKKETRREVTETKSRGVGSKVPVPCSAYAVDAAANRRKNTAVRASEMNGTKMQLNEMTVTSALHVGE